MALVAGSLVLLVVLLMVSLWFYADNSLHRVDAIDNYPGRPAGGAGTNELANRRLGLPARAQQRPGEPAAHRQ
jgi:hypothetical protein